MKSRSKESTGSSQRDSHSGNNYKPAPRSNPQKIPLSTQQNQIRNKAYMNSHLNQKLGSDFSRKIEDDDLVPQGVHRHHHGVEESPPPPNNQTGKDGSKVSVVDVMPDSSQKEYGSAQKNPYYSPETSAQKNLNQQIAENFVLEEDDVKVTSGSRSHGASASQGVSQGASVSSKLSSLPPSSNSKSSSKTSQQSSESQHTSQSVSDKRSSPPPNWKGPSKNPFAENVNGPTETISSSSHSQQPSQQQPHQSPPP